MTLTDIIIRDLAACQREEEAEMARKVAEKARRDYDRAITRRLWGRRWHVAGEIFGGILTIVGLVAFVWLCCACSGYNWE